MAQLEVWTRGESLAEGGPLVAVGGPLTKTQKKVKKDSEPLDICARQKNENATKNAKKQQSKEYQISKCQLERAQFLRLACQGGGQWCV